MINRHPWANGRSDSRMLRIVSYMMTLRIPNWEMMGLGWVSPWHNPTSLPKGEYPK